MKHLSILSIAVALLAATAVHAQAPMESAKAEVATCCQCTKGKCGCGDGCAEGKCSQAMECCCPEGCMENGKCMKECHKKCKSKCAMKADGKAKAGHSMDKGCCAKGQKAAMDCSKKMGKSMKHNSDMQEQKPAVHKRFHHNAIRK